MALSLAFMSALSESEGMITSASPGEPPASVLLPPLAWGLPRAGADGAAHISPSMLQWEDTAAAAGAREEG